jgi:two-component system, OmpR family, response regulator MtrA
MDARLLLIEDDPTVQALASLVLSESGFEVDTTTDVRHPDQVPWDRYHLVVLDVGLPSIDGISLCRLIRTRSQVPVLMLTARDSPEDVVAGLDAGADDYVTKPFVPEVLAARARAAVRRHVPGAGSVRLTVRDLAIDERASRAFRDGQELELTATEMRLLVVLARHAGEVLSRETLLSEVWGYDYLGDSRLVDMAVLRLRGKLGAGDRPPTDYIATVRGEGYRLDL